MPRGASQSTTSIAANDAAMWKIVRKSRWRLAAAFGFVVCILLLILLARSKCGIRGNFKQVFYKVLYFRSNRKLPKELMTTTKQDNITIISAFWDLGRFRKGSSSEYSPKDYQRWAMVFRNIVNPLIFYTDSKDFKLLMERYREKFRNKTKIILVTDRKKFWPFQILKEIQSVFQQPNYPKHYPNTVLPEYSASQHAKYAVVAAALKRNFFHTQYYAWLDVGYFRDATCEGENQFFRINPPPEVDRTRLSMNLVNQSLNINVSFHAIFKENYVWVGGGMFVATKEVLLRFERLYHRAVIYFLRRGLMNSDQQVIYAIYCKEGRRVFSPEVELQLFWLHGSRKVSTSNMWFYLGYLCLEHI